MWGPAWDGPPEACWYVGVQVGADAAQEDDPDDFDLRDHTDYGAPVVRVCPAPFFVEGADNVCPVWWQGGPARDDVPEAVGEDAEEMGGEVVVCLCREAVVAWGFVLPETVDGLPDFVDGEGAFFQLPPLGVVEDPREAVDFGPGVSGSSVSWVGVCCRRKLSWVAWSTVAGSLVREPSSCQTVVMVRWPVSVMASLRWRMAL